MRLLAHNEQNHRSVDMHMLSLDSLRSGEKALDEQPGNDKENDKLACAQATSIEVEGRLDLRISSAALLSCQQHLSL